eukprot:GHVU01088620.1.p1 GENE.GHVU01088620.1~~GHVU01088620.1.p1  ORF type:complete len:120 (+),score=2.06 GHVU01088620.1:260-619(+)
MKYHSLLLLLVIRSLIRFINSFICLFTYLSIYLLAGDGHDGATRVTAREDGYFPAMRAFDRIHGVAKVDLARGDQQDVPPTLAPTTDEATKGSTSGGTQLPEATLKVRVRRLDMCVYPL